MKEDHVDIRKKYLNMSAGKLKLEFIVIFLTAHTQILLLFPKTESPCMNSEMLGITFKMY